jgi:hypothetical protein
MDALEISGGLLTGGRMSPSRMMRNDEQEAYFKNEARAFRKGLKPGMKGKCLCCVTAEVEKRNR